MAWSRDRVDSSNINNGNEYQKGDRVSRQQLNAMVNAGLYSQDFVEALTETPVVNNEEVNANPTVNLIPYDKNGKQFYKFEFNNIKGKTGATGVDGQSATISGVTAEILNEGSNTPSIDVRLGGTPTDRTFHFVFKDILSGNTGPSALLYDELGDNTDGALTQKKSTEELNKKVEFDDEGFTEDLPTIQTQIDSLNTEIENLRKLLSVSSLPLGTIISSAIMQGSSSLHLLDGGELSIGGTYDAFCQFVIEAYNRDNTSIPVTDLETYQSEIATYGQCGKFVITDTYIKLPIITKYIEGLTDITDLGRSLEVGLPNIKGSFIVKNTDYDNQVLSGSSGAFSQSTGASDRVVYDRSTTKAKRNVSFDASKSNPIYGNSDTVQPQATKYPYYIVIGTVNKTEVEVNLDNVASDLNNKLSKTECVRYPVAKWTNTDGTLWYIVYNDEWKECGGFAKGAAYNSSSRIIALPIEFSNTNYSIIATPNTTGGNYSQDVYIDSKTVNSFGLVTAFNSNNTAALNCAYYACGY
jgi:hypothetical protein